MSYSDFYKALGINATDRIAVKRFAEASDVPVDRLQHYNDSNTMPSGRDLDRICSASGLSPVELMLGMGVLDRPLLNAIKANAREVFELIQGTLSSIHEITWNHPLSFFRRALGGSIKGIV